MSNALHPSQVHADAVLSTFARMYKNDEFIYDRVVSMIRVVKASDKYARYSKADVYTLADAAFQAGAAANEIGVRLGLDGVYSTKEYGLAGYVLDRTVRNADNPIQPRMDQTRLLVNQLMLAREKRVADLIFNPTSYVSGNVQTLTGNAQWSAATADPVEDVQTAIRSCLKKPNVLVFGKAAWDAFRSHEKVLRALTGAQLTTGANPSGGLAKRTDVAQLFEVAEVVVGEARYATDSFQNAQDASLSLQYLWGDSMAALYVERTPSGPDVLTHSGLFYTTPLEVSSAYVLQRKGEYVLACWDEDLKIIANDVGAYIADTVA